MRTETIPFDAAQYLREPEAQAELLADALDSGDATYIAAALGTIARAQRQPRASFSAFRRG
jgi:DNA-binding phage protein